MAENYTAKILVDAQRDLANKAIAEFARVGDYASLQSLRMTLEGEINQIDQHLWKALSNQSPSNPTT